jgi:hypothetical protein
VRLAVIVTTLVAIGCGRVDFRPDRTSSGAGGDGAVNGDGTRIGDASRSGSIPDAEVFAGCVKLSCPTGLQPCCIDQATTSCVEIGTCGGGVVVTCDATHLCVDSSCCMGACTTTACMVN